MSPAGRSQGFSLQKAKRKREARRKSRSRNKLRESASLESLQRAGSPALHPNLPTQMTTFDGRFRMASAFQNYPTSDKGTLPPSYSIPFTRTNQDHNLKKYSIGFMNEGTYTNACDPNSMKDQGNARNVVYNI